MFSQLSLNVADESVCWLQDECIPEASFLDSTCGSTYPADVPATPATSVTRSANRRLNSLQSPQSSSSIDLNTSAELNLLKFSLSHLNGESEPVGAKPSRPNGTKTLSETSLSDAAQENYSELHSSELSVSYDKSVVTVRCAASEFSTSDTQCDTSSKNVTSELHGEPPGTSTTVETNGEDISITSMPTTTCKILSVTTERAEGKTIAAQKRLYGEGPALPDGPAPSDVSSNIKSLLPPLRTASQLLRPKPGSALSRRFDASTSGLPMTRQRARALKNTSDAAQATRVSSSYRASKTGLPRPLCSGIPSGIQRPAATQLKKPGTIKKESCDKIMQRLTFSKSCVCCGGHHEVDAQREKASKAMQREPRRDEDESDKSAASAQRPAGAPPPPLPPGMNGLLVQCPPPHPGGFGGPPPLPPECQRWAVRAWHPHLYLACHLPLPLCRA